MMNIDWLTIVFRVRKFWSIWAILLISAFVNLLTQLPLPDWESKHWTLKVSGILGIVFILISGISSQILFEDLSAFLQAEKGAMEDAIKLVDKSHRKVLFGICSATITFAVLGISGWVLYRSC